MKLAILTGVLGAIAFISVPAAAGPNPGIYVRFVPYAAGNAAASANLTGCQSTGALVAEQNQSSRWPTWHPVQSMTLNVEQTLNIGSQSAGAGAGKITFNPLAITLPASSLDASFLDLSSSGTPFCEVDVLTIGTQGPTQLYSLRLAALKTVSWGADARGNTTSTYTFEYGGFMLTNQAYRPDGSMGRATTKGWNRVRNVSLTSPGDTPIEKLMP